MALAVENFGENACGNAWRDVHETRGRIIENDHRIIHILLVASIVFFDRCFVFCFKYLPFPCYQFVPADVGLLTLARLKFHILSKKFEKILFGMSTYKRPDRS